MHSLNFIVWERYAMLKNYIETLPIVNTKKAPRPPPPLTTILWFVKNLSLNIN
jgi:hypothetical protein